MVAIDTNVLVRLLTADAPTQYRASLKVFSSPRIFIADSVILETEWVLRAVYGLQPGDVCDSFRKVFGLPNVTLDDPQRIALVLYWHEGGLDFADGFHLALSQHCDTLETFDTQFIKGAQGLSTCSVKRA